MRAFILMWVYNILTCLFARLTNSWLNTREAYARHPALDRLEGWLIDGTEKYTPITHRLRDEPLF